ncbi:MAG: hypothetical protein IT292_04945 [Deltaproteobacteria bacterium]|nr:hypothetical protein [Deltaproteobacteria bacterium]
MQQHDTEAIASFTKALEIDPFYKKALVGRHDSLRRLGRNDEAGQDLKRIDEIVKKERQQD